MKLEIKGRPAHERAKTVPLSVGLTALNDLRLKLACAEIGENKAFVINAVVEAIKLSPEGEDQVKAKIRDLSGAEPTSTKKASSAKAKKVSAIQAAPVGVA